MPRSLGPSSGSVEVRGSARSPIGASHGSARVVVAPSQSGPSAPLGRGIDVSSSEGGFGPLLRGPRGAPLGIWQVAVMKATEITDRNSAIRGRSDIPPSRLLKAGPAAFPMNGYAVARNGPYWSRAWTIGGTFVGAGALAVLLDLVARPAGSPLWLGVLDLALGFGVATSVLAVTGKHRPVVFRAGVGMLVLFVLVFLLNVVLLSLPTQG